MRYSWPLSWVGKPVHSDVVRSTARFRSVVAARRSGKSELDVFIGGSFAALRPRSNVWLVAPTYVLGKEVLWHPLVERMPRPLVRDIHGSDFRMRLKNGSTIWLKSAEKPDSMLGRGLDLVLLDEYQSMHAHVFEHVIRPALADRRGRAVFTGTPRGFGNPLHDVYERGQPCTGQGQHAGCGNACLWADWRSWLLTAYEARVIAPEEIEAGRAQAEAAGPTAMRIWRREMLADFTAFVGQIFERWDPRTMVVDRVPERFVRMVAGMDWGFSESHAGVLVVVGLDEQGTWWVLECVTEHGGTISGYWLPRARHAAQRWTPAKRGTIWLPDDRQDGIRVFRWDDCGWDVQEAKRTPDSVWSGIVTLATLIERDKLRVHRSCDLLIKQLPAYRWEDTKDGRLKEQPHKAYDDAVDALRYALHSEAAMPMPWAA